MIKKYFLILLLPITNLNSGEPASTPIHNLSLIVDHKRANVSFVNFTTAHAAIAIQNHISSILISRAVLERILIARELIKDPLLTVTRYPELKVFAQPPDINAENHDLYFKKQTPEPSDSMFNEFVKDAKTFREWLEEAQRKLTQELEKDTSLEETLEKLPIFSAFLRRNFIKYHIVTHWALHGTQFEEDEWDMREVSAGFILLVPKTFLSADHTGHRLGLNLSLYKPITTHAILAGFKHEEIEENPNTTLPQIISKLFVVSDKYNKHPFEQPFWNIHAVGHGTPQDEKTPEGEIIGISIPNFTKLMKALNRCSCINQFFMASCFASDINLTKAFTEPLNSALSFTVNFDIITDAFTYQEVRPQIPHLLHRPTTESVNLARKKLHFFTLIDYGKDFFTSPKTNPLPFFRAMANKLARRKGSEVKRQLNFLHYRHVPTVRFSGTEQFFPLLMSEKKKLISPVFAVNKIKSTAKATEGESFHYTQEDYETFNKIDPQNIAAKPIGLYTDTILAPIVITIEKLFKLPKYGGNYTEMSRFPQIISQVPGNTFHYLERVEMPSVFYPNDPDDLETYPHYQLLTFSELANPVLRKEFFIRSIELTEPETGTRSTLYNLYAFFSDTTKKVSYYYAREKDSKIIYEDILRLEPGAMDAGYVKTSKEPIEGDALEKYNQALQLAEQKRTEALGEIARFKRMQDVQKKKIKKAKKVSYKKPRRRRYRFA